MERVVRAVLHILAVVAVVGVLLPVVLLLVAIPFKTGELVSDRISPVINSNRR